MQCRRAALCLILSATCFVMAALFGISGRAFADPPGIEITQWKHNKPGALTLTFDDGYAAQYSVGVAALNEHGLKGTFFVFTECASMCVPRHVSWDDWRSAAGAGHEIGSHSKTHLLIRTATLIKAQKQWWNQLISAPGV